MLQRENKELNSKENKRLWKVAWNEEEMSLLYIGVGQIRKGNNSWLELMSQSIWLMT